MADGYARNSGKLGVCCSTTGPGATNMITGVASAYENNVPMLVITAQTAISTFGKGAIQDSSCTGVNTVGLYSHCTRYNTLISHIDQLEHKLAAAIMSAMGSPAGPAHISVPRDVMAMDNLVSQTHYQLDALLDKPALIKHADSAMFRAKEKRDDFCFYERGMEAEIAKRLKLEQELRKAIDSDQLVLHYQPQIDFKTGDLLGAEALVRWEHPLKGLVSPDDFIPLAEESGLINQLTDWVLKNVAVQTKRWLDEGYSLRLAVNLSVKDLMQEDFHTKLEDLIKRSDLPPDVLELEITESTLMDHPELMIKELNKIKKMGITVAVDDFGSGYSSLNYLKKLPVDVLKIDRSFISDIESDPNDSAIVAGIIALAKNLGMSTVAEGVETEAQRKILEQLGCDTFQGYLVSKPVPPQLFTEQFLTAEKVI
jgi:EAL domain-containing protein (putative c-di-GMP-specific phosphodiesterase class I)